MLIALCFAVATLTPPESEEQWQVVLPEPKDDVSDEDPKARPWTSSG